MKPAHVVAVVTLPYAPIRADSWTCPTACPLRAIVPCANDTERLAVAYPDGSWWVDAGPGKPRYTGKAETQDDAKIQARNKLREIER